MALGRTFSEPIMMHSLFVEWIRRHPQNLGVRLRLWYVVSNVDRTAVPFDGSFGFRNLYCLDLMFENREMQGSRFAIPSPFFLQYKTPPFSVPMWKFPTKKQETHCVSGGGDSLLNISRGAGAPRGAKALGSFTRDWHFGSIYVAFSNFRCWFR